MPHTHWDREWHVPFQAGRVRLVRLLDTVLDDLEAGRLASFWLDGQTSVLDDYLAVRPEAEGRIRALVTGGRLGIGPWAVPMDEFVVSPETIVRNLEAGLRRRAELGAPAPAVGYLPDIFGHVGQLPQVLRLAGIDHAVVWRGVPAVIGAATTAFRWEAADGSSVRTEYLYGSYANGRSLPVDGPGLVERARRWQEEVGDRRVAGLLLMNGGDQRMPESSVSAAVAEANSRETGYRFEVVDLARWLEAERAAVPDDGLPVWRGELRSSAAAPVLAGVISNRVDVRAAGAAAERAVERRAEPLLALFRPAVEWVGTAPLLAIAWERLILNSAHDSCCACCADPVADQVLVRYAEARQIGDALADQALADLASETGAQPGDVLVANTRAATRSGVVEVTSPAPSNPEEALVGPDGIARAVQVLAVTRQEVFAARVAGPKVGWVVDRIVGRSFDGRPVSAWSLESPSTEVPPADASMLFEAAGPDDDPVDLEDARQALLAWGREGRTVAVRMHGPPQRTFLVETGPVPGFGWMTLRRPPGRGAAEEPAGMPVRVSTPPGGETVLDNGIVRVTVHPDDGTFSATTDAGLRAERLNRYVDGGDGGDTYTWCPPEVDTVVDRPDDISIDVVENGPLRGRVVVIATYHWPIAAEGDESACARRTAATGPAEIRTAVSLVAGDPVVHIETSLDNRVRDHRLRAHFPLPAPVSRSDAGCAFAVVRRGLETEGGLPETPPPTFPARRFVDCSNGAVGLAVVADGTFEYEVVEGGAEVAVTLLRATGWLSRRRLPTRPDPAGPTVPVEGAQVQGRRTWRYGVLLHSGDWERAHVNRRADNFLNPLEAVPGAGPADAPPIRPDTGRALRVDGAEVSAVLRDPDGVVIRFFNPGSELTTATVGEDAVALRPGEIATVTTGWRPGAG
ncbi:MAG TPA: glycoside hydrolase family 38 C-terminal domain-containing protein [Acidimicrobiia bacterium]|nr:glycoside hydrolase family 38 C-terminal domain-containing protein [Acidimicrobiia bacterium]